jgi:WD40 repeat protein
VAANELTKAIKIVLKHSRSTRQVLNRFTCISTLLFILGFYISNIFAQENPSPYSVGTLSISGDGTIIAAEGRGVTISNTEGSTTQYPVDFFTLNGEFVRTIPNNLSLVSFDLSPDGNRLVQQLSDGSVTVVNTISGIEIIPIASNQYIERGGVTWSPTDHRIAFIEGGGVDIYDGLTGQYLQSFVDHNSPGHITTIAWNEDGSRLASTTYYRRDATQEVITQIQIWDISLINPSPIRLLSRFAGGGSNSITWSPDGTQLATSSRGGVRVYDIARRQEVRFLQTPNNQAVFELDWSPDGTKIAGGGEKIISVWDVSTGQIVNHYSMPQEITDLEWSNNGDLFHTGGPDGIYKNGSPFIVIRPTQTP